MKYVLDASVAVKWVLAEQDSFPRTRLLGIRSTAIWRFDGPRLLYRGMRARDLSGGKKEVDSDQYLWRTVGHNLIGTSYPFSNDSFGPTRGYASVTTWIGILRRALSCARRA